MQPINFFKLRSLTLQNCSGANNLLDLLAESSRNGELKPAFFEIGYSGVMLEGADLQPLVRFLESFKGLQDLFYPFECDVQFPQDYLESILSHKSILRRFVHQEREIRLPLDNRKSCRSMKHLPQETSLECLGLCFELGSLVSLLAAFPSPLLLHYK